MKSGQTWTKAGERRCITGIFRVGQGRGVASKTGRVWWKEPPRTKEHSATMADFVAWMMTAKQVYPTDSDAPSKPTG